MLEITNLRTAIDGKKILNGRSLSVNAGEVHAMGALRNHTPR